MPTFHIADYFSNDEILFLEWAGYTLSHVIRLRRKYEKMARGSAGITSQSFAVFLTQRGVPDDLCDDYFRAAVLRTPPPTDAQQTPSVQTHPQALPSPSKTAAAAAATSTTTTTGTQPAGEPSSPTSPTGHPVPDKAVPDKAVPCVPTALSFQNFCMAVAAMYPLRCGDGQTPVEYVELRARYVFDVYDSDSDSALVLGDVARMAGDSFHPDVERIASQQIGNRPVEASAFDPTPDDLQHLVGSIFLAAGVPDQSRLDWPRYREMVLADRFPDSVYLFRLKHSPFCQLVTVKWFREATKVRLQRLPTSAVGLTVQYDSSNSQSLARLPSTRYNEDIGEFPPSAHRSERFDSFGPDVLVKTLSTTVGNQMTAGRISGFEAELGMSMLPPDLQWVHRAIVTLLLPRSRFGRGSRFPLSLATLDEIISQAKQVVSAEPAVIHCDLPVRIFGDIHGQYDDLLQFFHSVGYPLDFVPNGDILRMNYLFLGDYVDRGSNSLEVIALLFALKARYPNRIFLIRGNHEEREVNRVYGFWDECVTRFGRRDGDRIFEECNEVFRQLPLGCIVANAVLCVHGGIGRIASLWDIRALPKGVSWENMRNTDDPASKTMEDVLWSDPTTSDQTYGLPPNPRGCSVLYGPDIVRQFLRHNNLQSLVRAHEVTEDGIDWSAQGRVVTVFSATNYCGHHGNNGAVLELALSNLYGENGTKIALLQAKVLSAPSRHSLFTDLPPEPEPNTPHRDPEFLEDLPRADSIPPDLSNPSTTTTAKPTVPALSSDGVVHIISARDLHQHGKNTAPPLVVTSAAEDASAGPMDVDPDSPTSTWVWNRDSSPVRERHGPSGLDQMSAELLSDAQPRRPIRTDGAVQLDLANAASWQQF